MQNVVKDVLIVDDDEAVRTLVCTALTDAGLTCDTAADGVYALERLERTMYRVVLLDLAMPRMNGVDVLEKLKSMHAREGDRPIVLVITGATDREALLAHSEMVQIVIRKPIDVAHLGELVHDCVAARDFVRGRASAPASHRNPNAQH